MRIAVMLGCLVVSSLSTVAGDAERNWPNWRGPLHTGVSPHGNPPVEFSETQNVRFKVEIPGRGLSSPVVWGDRVFVTTAEAVDPDEYAESQRVAAEKREKEEWPPDVAPVRQRFLVLAYSRKDGSLLWKRTATERVPHETHYIDSGWSTASPVTDGKRVFAHFGSNGTYAFDFDGKPLWQIDLGDQTTRRGFGEGSSPALYRDNLIINWDHEGDSFLVVLDAATGKERWRVERPDEPTSWATPLVVRHKKRHQIIVPSTGRSRGYDLRTGREVWSISGMTVNTIPTPVHRDGVVYLASGYRGTMLQAVSLEKAQGPLENKDALTWTHDRDTPYVPSLLLYDDTVYFLKHFKNILSALDAATGEPRRDLLRLSSLGTIWASPVGAAGRIYLFDRTGKSVVLEHGPELKILAESELDGVIDSTPAIAGDEIYVRTRTHLYCLAQTPETTP